ncbi:hypothetical protein PMAYCL1PPCAC_07977, partial [Pristionchus mayeri]
IGFLSLLAISSAAPTFSRDGESNALQAEIDFLKEILVRNKINQSAIEELSELNINGLPFTTKIYEIYRDWSRKWDIDIPEFENEVGAALVNTQTREVESRTAEFLRHLESRMSPLKEYAEKGTWREDEIDASSEFERNLVEKVSEHMRYLIEGDDGNVGTGDIGSTTFESNSTLSGAEETSTVTDQG